MTTPDRLPLTPDAWGLLRRSTVAQARPYLVEVYTRGRAFPVATGYHASPEGAWQAARFLAEHGRPLKAWKRPKPRKRAPLTLAQREEQKRVKAELKARSLEIQAERRREKAARRAGA